MFVGIVGLPLHPFASALTPEFSMTSISLFGPAALNTAVVIAQKTTPR